MAWGINIVEDEQFDQWRVLTPSTQLFSQHVYLLAVLKVGGRGEICAFVEFGFCSVIL